MTFPVVFHLGPLGIPAHLVFEILAYTLGFQYYRLLKRREGDLVSGDARWTLIVAAAVGAAIGAKVLHHLSSPHRLLESWQDPAFLMGGKTIVGGILGGLLTVELTKKKLGITRRTGDLYALPLCLAIGIGRVGCFLTGVHDDTTGGLTSSLFGMDLGDGLMRHPTALYEIGFLIVLGLFIRWKGRRPHAEGELFAIFVIGYLAFRFCADFLKPYEIIFGLRGIQWACLFGLVHETRVWLSLRRPSLEKSHD